MTRNAFRWTLAAMLCVATMGLFAGSASAQNKKVLFFSKSVSFQHSVITRDPKNPTKPAWAEQILIDLGKQNGFDVTLTKDGDIFADPQTYKTYDVFAFYTQGDLGRDSDKKTRDGQLIHTEKAMSPEGKAMFLKAINDGKGFIGFHCASDTFHSMGRSVGGSKFNHTEVVDPYIECCGGEFCGHQNQADATMRFVSPDFPGLKGFKDFTMFEEWYSLKNFNPDLHVVLVHDTATTKDKQGQRQSDYQRPNFPNTWARKQGKGRVFYTAMGHREDVWTNPLFQQIAVAGLKYAGGTAEFDATPNISSMCPEADTTVKK